MTDEIKEEIKEQLKLLFLELHPKGITEFTIEYNGSGLWDVAAFIVSSYKKRGVYRYIS